MFRVRIPPVTDFVRRTAKIRTPGTTSNLGPGFDALGLALTLWNSFEIEETASGIEVSARGPGSERVPRDESNLVVRAFHAARRALGLPPPLGLKIQIEMGVPLGRGLGSSATATVAGIVAADALAGRVLEKKELAQLASEIEGHPDNAVACLLGGFVVCAHGDDGKLEFLRKVPPRAPAVVVASPLHFELSTPKMRAALPGSLAHVDATRSMGRACLLVAALLDGEHAPIARAMEDRFHEPYRAPHVPGFDAVKAAARGAGALGVALSGSGPSMLAFASDAADASTIGQAMTAAWAAHRVEAEARVLAVEGDGTVCVLDPPEPEKKRARTSRLRPS
jgi:homoserine kinase